MRNLLSRQRGKPPWKPSGRPFVMPAMPPAKLGSEKADRSSVDRWTEDCRPDLPVKVTRHESRRPGTASVAITNYIDRIPETNEPELGRLSIVFKGGMEESAPIHREFRVAVRGARGYRRHLSRG